MKKNSLLKLYAMELCGLTILLSILLPWISYGIGSKTGLDVGRNSVQVIFVSGALFLIFSYLHFKLNRIKKIMLYIVFILSALLFASFLIEIIRIGYQATMTKNLPVEMFGVASLATLKMHIGYGLWLGGAASLVIFIVQIISIKVYKK
ncbi:MAG: hypothetical protein V4591_06120 [Bdellovibrionota bacterium]